MKNIKEQANDLLDKLSDSYKNSYEIETVLSLSLANDKDKVVKLAFDIINRQNKEFTKYTKKRG